jgi:hypothetical protein
MTHAQQYIDTLLGHIPTWELKSIDNRNMLDEIKERLATCENLQTELIALFRVKGLADFALSLLWIMEKAESNPTFYYDPSADEEKLVFSIFKKATGEESASSLLDSFGSGAASEPAPEQGQQGSNPFTGFSFESSASPQKSDAIEQSAAGAVTPEQERSLADLLEKFLEAIQNAAEDRTVLMESVKTECRTFLALSSGTELHEFCRIILEFLDYVDTNQFIDDIRVMNIISNIQGPYLQWKDSAPENRAGILDPALEILRDFKSMFE